ncbi:MAG TPA: hypothetical protein VGB13_10990 [Candidatus Krumholzibacteria bacterium]
MWLAEQMPDVGLALFDYKTPMHFGVGFAAGTLGLNPHLAAFLFIAAKAGKVALEEGMGHALFGKKEVQSYGNEMMDLLAEMTGILAGLKTRSLITGGPALPAHGLGLDGKVAGRIGNEYYYAAAGQTPMVAPPYPEG